ncbi:MAG: 16S rRNA (uracil(1498)-N(3))-methyltransferase [Lentisphaeria bacterium]|nr:16S rRNA (uracil(1498)-N(3))-methyltransferase [Lentisphaeria bacterium]
MNLLLLKDNDFIAPGRVKISDRRFLQLRDIIKLENGKTFRAGMTGGNIGSATVAEFTGEYAVMDVAPFTLPPPEPAKITLVCALPRPQTFHKVLHCAITMGVKKIWFIHSRKVEKSYWQSSVLQDEAVDREIQLALEQCGDTIYPEIFYRNRFKPFAEDEFPLLRADADAAIFGHPRASEVPENFTGKRLVLLVGPEGGFSDYEVELFSNAGATAVTLGQRVLRTEFATAALLAKLI